MEWLLYSIYRLVVTCQSYISEPNNTWHLRFIQTPGIVQKKKKNTNSRERLTVVNYYLLHHPLPSWVFTCNTVSIIIISCSLHLLTNGRRCFSLTPALHSLSQALQLLLTPPLLLRSIPTQGQNPTLPNEQRRRFGFLRRRRRRRGLTSRLRRGVPPAGSERAQKSGRGAPSDVVSRTLRHWWSRRGGVSFHRLASWRRLLALAGPSTCSSG